MTGMRKRSTKPGNDQEKLKLNPLYNTSTLIKAVGDRFRAATKKSEPKRKPRQ